MQTGGALARSAGGVDNAGVGPPGGAGGAGGASIDGSGGCSATTCGNGGETEAGGSPLDGGPDATSVEDGGIVDARSDAAVLDGAGPDAVYCNGQLDLAVEQYDRFRQAYTNPSNIPRSAKNGSIWYVSASDWTSGFDAGCFWLLYEHTGASSWRSTAETWTAALASQQNRTSDHDIGFIINNTYGNGYRLTGQESYKQAVLTAAVSAITRFKTSVGAIRSWDYTPWHYPVIIDNMMNLELLFDATELGGNTQFRNTAITHALTTHRDHFRSDSSSYHVVDYNESDGSIISKKTAQGLSDESAWARGQAWGLYGFTMTYRKTLDTRFLSRAIAIADFYTQSADMPSDGVPYFDFSVLRTSTTPYRDASAGAIAASGLFELANYAPAEAAARYRAFAVKAVRSLSSTQYRAAANTNSHFLLMHSVGNYPQSSEIDVAINYADYYYIEALLRCKATR